MVIFRASYSLNNPKQYWTNEADLANFKKLEESIPLNAFVFDLTGFSLVFRDPYYICCVPYGQYIGALSSLHLESLSGRLEKTKTNYVMDNRLDTLSEEDRKYIMENYTEKMLDGLVLTK